MRSLVSAACVLLLFGAAGCNRCLEGFEQIQVGQRLPEKLTAGVYRSELGVGRLESGALPLPAQFWNRSLRVLTDDRGLVVAKAYKATEFADAILLVAFGRRQTILELVVPESWWREPVGKWQDEIPSDPVADNDWSGVRNELRRHPPAEQRNLVRQWRASYEGRLANPRRFVDQMKLSRGWPGEAGYRWAGAPTIQPATPEQLARRNVIRYLALVLQLLNALPAREGASAGADESDLSLSLHMRFCKEQDLEGLTREGFDRRGEDLRVRNLGNRRIRIERDDRSVLPLTMLFWGPAVLFWGAGGPRRALGRAYGERDIPALVAELDSSREAVRTDAAEALGKLGPAAGAAVPRLIQALRDPESSVRSRAAEALGRIGPAAADAIPAVAEALQDKESVVRDSAAQALGKIGQAAVPHLIQAWDPTDNERCELLANAFGRIGPPARPALPLLIPAVESDELSVQRAAIYALAEIGPPDRVAPVLTSVLEYSGPAAAHKAAETLASLGKPAVPHLLRALKSAKSYRVRADCLQAFQRVGQAGAPAVPVLIEFLQDPEAYLRLNAASALGNLGPPARKAIPALTRTLKDKEAKVRRCVAGALAKLGEAKLSMPVLLPDLSHEEWVYRCWAVEALGHLGPAAGAAVPKLVELAKQDEETAVREAAVQALAKIRGLSRDF